MSKYFPVSGQCILPRESALERRYFAIHFWRRYRPTLCFIKMWQYIRDHNSGKSWWILIILHIWKREWMPSASNLFTYHGIYFTSDKYDVTVTFMTLMSCDSVCCMCGEASISRWLMTQLTNGQHACVLVFVPMVGILNIPCNCQFFSLYLMNFMFHTTLDA